MAERLFAAKSGIGYPNISPFELKEIIVQELQSPIGAARLSGAMQANVLDACLKMDDAQRRSIGATIRLAVDLRKDLDWCDMELCADIGDRDAPRYVATIADVAYNYTPALDRSFIKSLRCNKGFQRLPVAEPL